MGAPPWPYSLALEILPLQTYVFFVFFCKFTKQIMLMVNNKVLPHKVTMELITSA